MSLARKNSVQVVEKQSLEVLFECPLSEIEKAYQQAKDYESMDLDVEIRAPGSTETLLNTLGIQGRDRQLFAQSIEEEIDSHQDEEIFNEEIDSCCVKSGVDNTGPDGNKSH